MPAIAATVLMMVATVRVALVVALMVALMLAHPMPVESREAVIRAMVSPAAHGHHLAPSCSRREENKARVDTASELLSSGETSAVALPSRKSRFGRFIGGDMLLSRCLRL